MKISALRYGGGLSIVAALLVPACSDRPVAECVEVFPFAGPGDGEFLLLAEATGEVIQIPPSAGQPFADSDLSQVQAHRFLVRQVASALVFEPGPPPRFDVETSPFARSDTILIVPWSHDRDCNPTAWNKAEWVPTGMPAVFWVTRARFSRGEHVIDVPGDYWPYPFGSSIKVVSETRPPDDLEDWLSPQEFFELLSQLPKMDPTRTRDEQFQEIDHEFRTGPTRWVEKFPGPEILRRARAWAEAGGNATP